MERSNLFIAQPALFEFVVNGFYADLIEFVDCYSDVHYLIRRTDDFGDTGKDLTVVNMQAHTDAETAIDLLYDLDKFQLTEQAVRTNDIHVALIELAVTSFLRTVGTPDGLNLETFEGERELFAVLYHVTRERNGQVVTQTFLRCKRGFLAAVLDAEKELVAFLSVLTHEGTDVLHCGSLYLLKTIQGKDTLDRVEDIIAARHLELTEVTRAFGNTGLCHSQTIYNL